MIVKYSAMGLAICACVHVFLKRPWCTCIRDCAVNRTNTVLKIRKFSRDLYFTNFFFRIIHELLNSRASI